MATRLMHRLHISILDSSPQIWRTVDVDSSMRLDELHDTIQIIFGWAGGHLHQFHNIPRRPQPEEPTPRFWSDPAFELENHDDTDVLDQRKTTIATALADGNPLYYEYDFGDGWVHQIELIEETPATAGEPRATIVSGEMRGPLEDSGGPHGYRRKLEALADPAHPDHQEVAEWIDEMAGLPYDPHHFDSAEINQELAEHFGQ